MRIGVFYETLEDFQSGKSSRMGVINEWGEWAGELPPKVAAYVKDNPHCFDEAPGADFPEHVRELLPNHALEVAEICDDCGEVNPCQCVLEKAQKRREAV